VDQDFLLFLVPLAVDLQPLQHERCGSPEEAPRPLVDEDRPVALAGPQRERLVED